MRLAGGPAPQRDGPGLWLQQTAGCGLHPPDRYVSSRSVSASFSKREGRVKRANDGRLGLHAIAEDYLITIVLSAPPPLR